MCMGLFWSVLQVELSSGESSLAGDWESVQVGVFLQEAAAQNCCHREMCPHPHIPTPQGSGHITLLEESI